jgi:hypothetical protein
MAYEPHPLEPSEDPSALDPQHAGPVNPDGYGGAGPWWRTPPGGILIPSGDQARARFFRGVPSTQPRITPFDHVLSRAGMTMAQRFSAGTPQGNTGFRGNELGNIPPGWLTREMNSESDIGDVSSGAKDAATGVFLLGALGLLYFLYAKPARAR